MYAHTKPAHDAGQSLLARDARTVEPEDTVEAHYSDLECLLPHACIGGWVFVGYVDEYGEERLASYLLAIER